MIFYCLLVLGLVAGIAAVLTAYGRDDDSGLWWATGKRTATYLGCIALVAGIVAMCHLILP